MKTTLSKRTILPMAAALWMANDMPARLYSQTSVQTWHNDNARTGQNLQETALTPANVNQSTFGKLFTIAVDGKVDAEPLYVPALVIPGKGTHNVLFVVTEHDTAYAFDADTGTQLWQVSLLLAGESPSDNRGCTQVTPEIGITSTPVIDLQTGPHGTIYAVAMSKNGSTYHHRLHALDLTTGAEEFNGPMEVQATYPGHGDGSVGGVLTFDPKQYKDRAGLLIWNGTLFTSWASHCDIFPYTAWVIGYDKTNLSRVSVLNLTPNGSDGSVWGAGAGPAADANGAIYLLMANGTFDTTLNASGFPANGDYGNAFVKIVTGGTTVADYFTMSNTVAESAADQDLGSGGLILLPPLNDAQGHARNLAVGAGKDGNIYVVDQANLGKFNASTNAIYQELPSAVGGVFSTPAWFNGKLYYGGVGDTLKAFAFSNGTFGSTPASHSANAFPYPGTTPSISANGTSNGIVWAAENSGTAVLHAYDAGNLATELYNSNQAAGNRDHFGAGNKFIVPMVANGKVYVGTTNGVGVFGLLCGSASNPIPGNSATGVPVNATLSWTAGTGATAYDVALSTTNPPTVIASGLTGVSYTVTSSLAPGTKYYWYLVTHNCAGTTQSPTWSFTTAGGSSGSSATFVKLDTTTQGNWKGVYGANGYNVIGNSVSYPSYVAVTPAGASPYTWAASTADPRALLKPGSPSDRVAAAWYSPNLFGPGSFTIDLAFSDQATHQVAAYCVDFDSTTRAQTITVQDAGGAVLDTRSVASFNGGQYLVWNLSGHVRFVFAWTAGYNAVVSGLFFDAPGGTGQTGTATFVKVDGVTAGNWKGVYGASGHNVIGDSVSYPSYVAVTPAGNSTYIWAASTSDSRALQKASSSTDRVAATWYSPNLFGPGSFTIDLAFSDQATHQVAAYCLDFDSTTRAQTITVQDANGVALDTRSMSSFNGGQYLVWNLSGHVRLVFAWTGGYNAVVSGLFFDAPGGSGQTGTATFVKVDGVTEGNWKGVYGANGYNVIGDSVSYPSYVAVTPAGNSTYTWAASTSDPRALQKPSSSADRIAATWYSPNLFGPGSFTIDLAFSDQATHQVAAYCLDFDSTTRAQTVTVQDANGVVLDTRSMSSFNGGQYLVWNLSGHVRFVFAWTGGYNAVVSGLFFN